MRYWTFVSGVVVVIWGIWTVFERRHPYWGYYIDLGEYHWVIGIAMSCLGVSIVISSFRKRTIEEETGTLICPSCRKPYNKQDLQSTDCPECNVPLEQVEGFYDRHPEDE